MFPHRLASYVRSLPSGISGDVADGELLDRYRRAADPQAFAELVRRFGPTVFGVCRRVLSHEQDTEDAFQTTFLVLAQQAERIDRRQLAAWIHTVAYRAATKAKIRRARAARREQRVEPMISPTEEPRADWDELKPFLDEALDALPDSARAVVILCDVQGHSHRRAALELGVPAGSVAALLARGRRLLRERLIEKGVVATAFGCAAMTGRAAEAVPERLIAAASGFAVGREVPAAVAELTRELGRESARLSTGRWLALSAAALGAVGAGWFVLAADQPEPKRGRAEVATVPAELAPGPRLAGQWSHPEATALAASPDGSQFASVGTDGTARLWDASGRELHRWDAPKGGAASIAFSPDGAWLAAERADGGLSLWRTDTGKIESRVAGPKGRIAALAFSADSRYLAVADSRTLVFLDLSRPRGEREEAELSARKVDRLWKAVDPKPAVPPAPARIRPVALGVDRGEKMMLLATDDLSVKAIHFGTYVERNLKGPPPASIQPPVTASTFAPGGRYLAYADASNRVRLVDVVSGSRVGQLNDHRAAVTAIAFLPDGSGWISADESGVVLLSRLAIGNRLQVTQLAEAGSGVRTLVVSPGGGTVLLGGGPRIEVRSLEPRKEPSSVPKSEKP